MALDARSNHNSRSLPGTSLVALGLKCALALVGAIVTSASAASVWQVVLPSGDSSGAQDTAHIVAAEAALPPNGGTIVLGPGDFFLSSNGVVFTKPTHLEGQGSSDGYGYLGDPTPAIVAPTTIHFDFGSGTAVTFAAPASGCQGVHFSNEKAADIGSAAISLFNASGSLVHSCSTFGFGTGIVVTGGTVGYTLAFNKIYSPSQYGIWISNTANSDEGDPQVIGNMMVSGISPDSVAAVFYQSGGGAKFVGNKINSDVSGGTRNNWQYGIWMQPPTGSVSGIIPISGNSIENVNNDAVFVDNSAGGHFGVISITGNEFLVGGAALHTGAWPWLVSFVGNVVTASTNFVNSNGQSGLVAAGNVGNASGAMIAGAGFGLAVDLATNVVQNPTRPQVLMTDTSYTDTGNNLRNGGNRYVTREIPNLAPVGTKVGVYQVTVPAGQTVIAELSFAGTMSGVGGYAHRAARAITNAGGALSIATVGADFESGVPLIAWAFDDWGSGLCQISVSTLTGVGLNTSSIPGIGNGEINLRIYGLPASIARN